MPLNFPLRSNSQSAPRGRRSRGSSRAVRARTQLEVQSLEPRLALAAVAAPADLMAPVVKSIAPPPVAQTYTAGDTLQFRVNFSEKVFVTGTPTLPVMIGGTLREAVWNGKGGNGARSIVFTTAVEQGDVAPAGVRIEGEIDLPEGASIRDKTGNELIPRVSATFRSLKVDAAAPVLTQLGPISVRSNHVTVQATFTEPVIVKGRPHVAFTLAGQPRTLVYAGGSGGRTLTFRYQAARGESPTAENVAAPALAIVLGSGKISDKAGNAVAALAMPPSPPPQSAAKPSLLSSDWLRVDTETGEFDGDEPVLLTLAVKTVLGKRDSTTVDKFPTWPEQLRQGVDKGDTIPIPNDVGDIWFRNVRPLSLDDIITAWGSKLEVPVQLTVRLAFEGDMSSKYMMGTVGNFLAGYIADNLGKALEAIEIKPSELIASDFSFDKTAAKKLYAKILGDIAASANASALQITNAVLVKVLDLITAGGDPDDLVGIGITALVPVDDGLAKDLTDRGGPKALQLDDNWTKSEQRYFVAPVVSYSGDVVIRTGLLVGGKQSWQDTLQGRTRGGADNAWARWVVGTDAWREVNW